MFQVCRPISVNLSNPFSSLRRMNSFARMYWKSSITMILRSCLVAWMQRPMTFCHSSVTYGFQALAPLNGKGLGITWIRATEVGGRLRNDALLPLPDLPRMSVTVAMAATSVWLVVPLLLNAGYFFLILLALIATEAIRREASCCCPVMPGCHCGAHTALLWLIPISWAACAIVCGWITPRLLATRLSTTRSSSVRALSI